MPATHLAGETLRKRKIRPPKVEFEFTDLDLTAFGGASILARTARRFGLFELLDEVVSVKVRDRGASGGGMAVAGRDGGREGSVGGGGSVRRAGGTGTASARSSDT